MAEPGTLKGRHYAQLFLILLLFMFAVFTRHSIWIYYVRTIMCTIMLLQSRLGWRRVPMLGLRVVG